MIRFYLDKNNNLHIEEKGVSKIKLVDFDNWIDNKNLFSNINDLTNYETYPYNKFKEFEVDEDQVICNILLEEKSINELKHMQEFYFV